jgi:lysophospholipid acyltransferase (LPLAT)-like uncharacterized protein
VNDRTLAPHRPRTAALVAGAARALAGTWRWRREGGEALRDALADGPVIYAFWHGEQLPLALAHAGQGVVGMASRSRDGDLLAGVIERLGYGVVRGSTSQGGPMALRGCLRALRGGRSVAIAVDGPRGPRHQIAPGAAALAVLSQRPVVCARASARWRRQLSTWDRFEIPGPGARVTVRYAALRPHGDAAALTAAIGIALRGLTEPNAPAPGTAPRPRSARSTPSSSSRS